MRVHLQRETTLPIKWIANRVGMGSWKSASSRLHFWKKPSKNNDAQEPMLILV